MMKKFFVGNAYVMHSPCDWECVWVYEVTKRTECSVWVKEYGTDGTAKRFLIRKAISEYRGAESILPLGNYSMAPVLSADTGD